MNGYLSEIVTAHRARAAADGRDVAGLLERARAMPQPRPFASRVRERAATGLAVVAEVKRRSPSKGDLAPALDPAALAAEYEAGGATCVSVLTDERYFGGSADDLAAARQAVSLPVLRKDFVVCEADVCDARLMGADALLLIVAALRGDELRSLHALAVELAMDVLVEVHDDDELDVALLVGATLVGVNRRDLRTFSVKPDRADRLVAAIPPEVVAIAESGVSTVADAAHLAAVGFDGVLVGECLVRAGSPRAAVGELVGHPVGERRQPLPGPERVS
ncbi:MAG: indole-3-glycerol phosphate synthase TrpC [Actinomycetota bacterium]|nr:indole-3-glycerol phosphate synthase TrpC [Actinomycetota bacterium]